jgi:aminoglycoside phosphotransferase (APT) family kinase protein
MEESMPEMDFAHLLAAQPEAFPRRVLEAHGIPAESLVAAGGWSNGVWLTHTHVVRLSSGRFRDAFAHEAAVARLLPQAVPHARVLASGQVGRREWVLQERIPGRPLIEVWPRLSRGERQVAVAQLGAVLRALHAAPLPTRFANPWLTAALAPGGQPRDAYHAPPERHEILLAAASRVPGVDHGVLAAARAFIAERLVTFTADAPVLVHSDVHFSNLLWADGHIMALLDFEGSRPAAPDLELDTLLRLAREPHLYRYPDGRASIPRDELRELPFWLASAYPELFSHPDLRARLAVYETLWQLVQLLHFPPSSGIPDPWGHLLDLLKQGDHWAAF